MPATCERPMVRRGEATNGLTRYHGALLELARSALPMNDVVAVSLSATSSAALSAAARFCSAIWAASSCAGGGSESTASLIEAVSACSASRRVLRAANVDSAWRPGVTRTVKRSSGVTAGSPEPPVSMIVVPVELRAA